MSQLLVIRNKAGAQHWPARKTLLKRGELMTMAVEGSPLGEADTELPGGDWAVRIDGIFWEADADTLTFRQINGSVDEILGYSAEEWLGQADFWESKLHPEDAEWVLRSCAEASRKREPHRLTYRMIAADGRAVWLQDNVKVTVDGEHATLHGIMIDVTELIDQRDSLARMNEANAHFRTLCNLVPVAIWEEDWSGVLDALRGLAAQGVTDVSAHSEADPGWVDQMLGRLKVQAVNRAAVEMFGADSDEELIRRATEVFDVGKPNSVFVTALNAILHGKTELEGMNKLRRLDGAPVHVMFRISLPLLEARQARVVICEMDVSAEYIANERFELVARATSDVIWDFDIVKDKLWSSDGLRRVFGLNPDEMQSSLTKWTDRIHAEDRERILHHYDRILNAGHNEWEQDYRFRKGDGSYAVVRDEGFIQRDEQGAAVRMVGSLVDITEQRRLEERLIQSQKLEAMGKLTGGIAHDFNNLLTIVLGSLEVLEDHVGDNPDACRYLAAATRAVDRSTQLISQLLSYARLQPMTPRSMDMSRQVKEMSEMITRSLGEQIVVTIESAADLWPCRADPAQFENALLNLCINARDAMAGGGRLTIAMRNQRVEADSALAPLGLAPGDFVVLAVSDTGAGMDAATVTAAFDPFFTTKEVGAGSGLGLSMVQGFAQQSKGLARIVSAPGKGTLVEVYLPAQKSGKDSDAAPAPTIRERAAGTGRVLLVEDQDMVRAHMINVLESLGYVVLPTDSAAPAVAALERDERIDLLLTDIVLPGGESGLALAEKVRQLRPDLPVIFTSGFPETREERGVELRVGQNFLRKPFRRDELAEVLRRSLHHTGLPAR